MVDLFQKVDFKSHAGLDLSWKIEMDALSDKEWMCIAHMIVELSDPFQAAIGIPRGGLKLSGYLNDYGSTQRESDPYLIVDDVMTTGGSMEEYKKANFKDKPVIGLNTWELMRNNSFDNKIIRAKNANDAVEKALEQILDK